MTPIGQLRSLLADLGGGAFASGSTAAAPDSGLRDGPFTEDLLHRRIVELRQFPNTPIVVEVLGDRFHRTASQMARDADRINALLTNGYRPDQFTHAQVVSDPTAVIATVETALRLSCAS